MKIYRQGDILFVNSETPPPLQALVNPIADKIVARGELTGHAHVADEGLEVYENEGTLYLKGAGSVMHNTHRPIELPEGTYRMIQQREFAPEMERGHRTVRD